MLWNHCLILAIYKMKTQMIVNLLNDTHNGSSKLATRKWYIVNDQNNTKYGEGNENDTAIKLETRVIETNLRDFSDGHT